MALNYAGEPGMTDRAEQEKRERMLRVLSELRDKIGEIDELKKQLKDIQRVPASAERSRALLEEIRVPSLELIQEAGRRPRPLGPGK